MVKPRCRYCRTNKHIIPIVYAFKVDKELLKQQEDGKIKIGGAFIAVDRPNWHCKKCGNEFLR